jgi:Na+-translocating ferredoxin:NAD+ oxidoreductase RnfA subunit
MDNIMNLLPFFIIVAVALTVAFTELIKKLDKKDRLQGYRVYVPLVVSFVIVFLLKIGNFFVTEQMWFWWAVIFGFSIFGYEAVLRKVSNAIGKKNESSAHEDKKD